MEKVPNGELTTAGDPNSRSSHSNSANLLVWSQPVKFGAASRNRTKDRLLMGQMFLSRSYREYEWNANKVKEMTTKNHVFNSHSLPMPVISLITSAACIVPIIPGTEIKWTSWKIASEIVGFRSGSNEVDNKISSTRQKDYEKGKKDLKTTLVKPVQINTE